MTTCCGWPPHSQLGQGFVDAVGVPLGDHHQVGDEADGAARVPGEQHVVPLAVVDRDLPVEVEEDGLLVPEQVQ